MSLAVIKRNKRLLIVDEAGKTVYAAPDFLKPVRDRDVLRALAEKLSHRYDIEAVMAFESAHAPERRPLRRPPLTGTSQRR